MLVASVEDTIFILRGLKENTSCITEFVSQMKPLSRSAAVHRYINERFLPDKAIDVVDEAASHIRIRTDSKPISDIQTLQLKIEQAALQREQKSDITAQRLPR